MYPVGVEIRHTVRQTNVILFNLKLKRGSKSARRSFQITNFSINSTIYFSKVFRMSLRSEYLSWEDYFMATALLTSQRSKDPVTQVGACIVDKNNLILAVGYNGFPRNCNDLEFPWGKDKENPYNDKKMYVVHAEANAILNKNSANLSGACLYTTLFPCNECTKIIIQSGIKEVVYISDKHCAKPSYQASKRMLDAVGIKHRRYIPTKRKIVLDFDLFTDSEEDQIDISKLEI